MKIVASPVFSATTSAVLKGAHATCTQPHDGIRYDRDSPLVNVALFCAWTRPSISGLIRAPPLPHFTACFCAAMASSRQYQVPPTPRVISPSPTPSEAGNGKDGYFPPVTRASARKNKLQSPPPIEEDSSGSDPEKRARARSRNSTTMLEGGMGRRKVSGLTSRRQQNGGAKVDLVLPSSTSNGHLSPAAANKNYWREMSRSPSPLGLIPIHQEWRSFVRARLAIMRESKASDMSRFIVMRYPARSSTSPSDLSQSTFTAPAASRRTSTRSCLPCSFPSP